MPHLVTINGIDASTIVAYGRIKYGIKDMAAF